VREPFPFQVLQPGGEQPGAEAAQAGLEVAESLGSGQQLADQQQGPAFADEVQGARVAQYWLYVRSTSQP
jgi:hypothetical protein